MTAPDPLAYGLPLTAEGHPDFENARYDVFNPARTVGVRSNLSGRTLAVHLEDAVAALNEEALHAEILKVVSVATVRSSYAVRERAEYWAAVRGEVLEPSAVEAYAKAEDVEAARREAFGTGS
ncbi:hypothetical protein [Tsukamurella pseudospumae]|uniref:Antitoxin VbhA domain-containing protein n=1 Tax=Tsukamurella pseudospumae TaxID=239498 RepID=A0A137Z816_9ACTN|nr:hypothetical protein [Tsukamurella pseudospumae]KXO94313.1 hypothetical protein AXK61_23850 [Tsukamurella pseudospumae]